MPPTSSHSRPGRTGRKRSRSVASAAHRARSPLARAACPRGPSEPGRRIRAGMPRAERSSPGHGSNARRLGGGRACHRQMGPRGRTGPVSPRGSRSGKCMLNGCRSATPRPGPPAPWLPRRWRYGAPLSTVYQLAPVSRSSSRRRIARSTGLDGVRPHQWPMLGDHRTPLAVGRAHATAMEHELGDGRGPGSARLHDRGNFSAVCAEKLPRS